MTDTSADSVISQIIDDPSRRSVLQSAAMLTVSHLALGATDGGAASSSKQAVSKPGDFNFLAGEWRINHRRLKGKTWDEFKGEATCWTILGGIGSIEELRIPARDFSGMGLRLLDLGRHEWCDYWVNGKSGVLTPPPLTGGFIDGAGVFISDEEFEGKPIKVRGLWDRITPTSCRWSQATSNDAGKTWEDNWVMDWTRAPKP